MTGRRDRRAGRYPVQKASYVDPGIVLGASYGWRASDASAAGGNTAQWNPYLGAVILTPVGTSQTQPAAYAPLGGKLAVPFVGSGHYEAALALTSLTYTFAWVGTVSSGTSPYAATVAGAVNTCTALLQGASVLARRFGATDLSVASSPPVTGIYFAVVSNSVATLYYNSVTGTTSATAATMPISDTFHLGALSNSGTQRLIGNTAQLIIWTRALSNAEVGIGMRGLGSYYGQVIT